MLTDQEARSSVEKGAKSLGIFVNTVHRQINHPELHAYQVERCCSTELSTIDEWIKGGRAIDHTEPTAIGERDV